MNILVISNNLERASFRQRIGIYLDILRKEGIKCEVAQLPLGSLARRKLFKRAANFDGVFLQKKRLNILDARWLRRYARKIIYDFDDAVMYSEKSPERPSRKRMMSFQRTAKQADLVIAGNSYLAEQARKHNSNVKILPTGLNISDYTVCAKPGNNGKIRLVWIGSKSTLSYLAEIRPALEEIGSRFRNVILRIISDKFFDLRNIQVEKRLWSEQTQAGDLAASNIGLAPLPDNLFTRGKCGFKVLQYAAAGLPVVASLVGVNSEYVRNGVTGFSATSISQWTDRIAELITNATLRETMGKAGKDMVHSFDVGIIGKGLVNLIAELYEYDNQN